MACSGGPARYDLGPEPTSLAARPAKSRSSSIYSVLLRSETSSRGKSSQRSAPFLLRLPFSYLQELVPCFSTDLSSRRVAPSSLPVSFSAYREFDLRGISVSVRIYFAYLYRRPYSNCDSFSWQSWPGLRPLYSFLILRYLLIYD